MLEGVGIPKPGTGASTPAGDAGGVGSGGIGPDPPLRRSNEPQQTSQFLSPRIRRIVTRCGCVVAGTKPHTGVGRLQEPAVVSHPTRALFFHSFYRHGKSPQSVGDAHNHEVPGVGRIAPYCCASFPLNRFLPCQKDIIMGKASGRSQPLPPCRSSPQSPGPGLRTLEVHRCRMFRAPMQPPRSG